MRLPCSSCETVNPEAARFCMACGHELEPRCAACGESSPRGGRFCMACGAELAATPPTAATQPARASSALAAIPEERRQVTVMFADLSGYTAVAEQMDPEAVKALIDRCLTRLAAEVERFGGVVDKYIGDNVMAVFGAPVAHEDDPERALRAAFAMRDALAELSDELAAVRDARFGLRVGINTGEVLAGAVGDRYTVTGDTVNVAARLQTAAPRGSILVGEATHRAVGDCAELRALDPLSLRGKSQPVAAWEAVALADSSAGRWAAGVADSPLVGREEDLTLIDSLLARALGEGRAQLLTVVGQAGVGKSRLAAEVATRADSSVAFLEGRCPPYGSAIGYWALGEMVRLDAGIVESDDSEAAWSKLSGRAHELGGPGVGAAADVVAARVGRLIGIDAPAEIQPTAPGDPKGTRERLFAAVRMMIEVRTGAGPLVAIFEDIHWADDGLLDLIEYLAQWVRGPLLLICLARDELLDRRPSWGGGRRPASTILLDALTPGQTHELVEAMIPAGAEPGAESVALAVERAQGNPLFAKELVRRLVESGASDPTDMPSTVQGVLSARIDSLEPLERRLVQQAAVLGRSFPVSALAGLAAAEGDDLDAALASLEEKGVLEPSSVRLAGERELSFKHVLVRDVAYALLPRAVRAIRHFEAGCIIEQRAGDRADEVVALLAEHYGRAARLGAETNLAPERLEPLRAKALRWLEAAGDAAASLYSNEEALVHYEAARELVDAAGSDVDARLAEKQADAALRTGRVDAALELWADALSHHRAANAPSRVAELHRKIAGGLWHKGEVEQAIDNYRRGIGLLERGGPSPGLVRLYEEAAWLYMTTGDNMLAVYAAERTLLLADQLDETGTASRTHGIFGRVFGRTGNAAKARENLERSVELARLSDREETVRALMTLGDHLEVSSGDYLAAEEAFGEGLAIAQRLGDVPAELDLHSALARLAVYRADWGQVRRYLDVSSELIEREGLGGKLCVPQAMRGVLRWREGDFAGAQKEFRRAAETAARAGWPEVRFRTLFGLATAFRDGGDMTAAEAALDDALEACERAGLTVQSIEAIAARALVATFAGRPDEARKAAGEARELAQRWHSPAGRAAAVEAEGITAAEPSTAAALLREARTCWQMIGRPLEAARCELLAGRALLDYATEDARAALETSAREYEALETPTFAGWARLISSRAASSARDTDLTPR